MSVKLIAVDMDGTFLNDNKEYNYKRFKEQYDQMKKMGIKFVVASGNQYYQLKSFFPEIESEIAFVAENGAYIIDAGKEVFVGEMTSDTIVRVLNLFEDIRDSNLVVCGKNSAYLSQEVSEEIFEQTLKYYHKLKRVADLYHIDDTIFKFAATFPAEQVPDLMELFQDILGNVITPVSSGHGDIDLIIPGVHKARGIQLLQQEWKIEDHETVAFGDSGNDFEMIQHAQYGFAMANAAEKIKEIADYTIGSNNTESILDTIDAILNNAPPFKIN